MANFEVLPTLELGLFVHLLLLGKLYLLYYLTPIFRYDLGVYFQRSRSRNLLLDLACMRHLASALALAV